MNSDIRRVYYANANIHGIPQYLGFALSNHCYKTDMYSVTLRAVLQ